MLGVMQARKGVRLQGPVVEMTTQGVANAINNLLFQVSNYAAQIGVRTFRLKRVKGYNEGLADTIIHIGTGSGAGVFAHMIPPLYIISLMNFDFVEADLPEVEWTVDMTCYPDAATVANSVWIQVEIEELG